MLRKTSTCALLFCIAAPVCIGGASTAFGGDFWGGSRTPSGAACGKCAHKHNKCSDKCADKCAKVTRVSHDRPSRSMADLPPNAVEGECYAKVFLPPQYRTVSERTLIKEASETIEIIPGETKEVEERVMVKDCIKQLEVIPAEYRTEERRVQIKPGHTSWVLEKTARCVPVSGTANGEKVEGEKQEMRDVYCLVSTPPEYKTISIQCLVKPASVREVVIPAQYETIRRQVVVCPPRAKKVCHQAEYADLEKTVLVSDGGMKWERVICERNASADTF